MLAEQNIKCSFIYLSNRVATENEPDWLMQNRLFTPLHVTNTEFPLNTIYETSCAESRAALQVHSNVKS